MKIIKSILLTSILIFAIFTTIAIAEDGSNIDCINIKLNFNIPGEDDFKSLSTDFDDKNSYIMEPGKPILPCYRKTIKFPVGTNINEIKITLGEVIDKELKNKLNIAPTPIQIKSLSSNRKISEKKIELNEPYPQKNIEYNIFRGIENDIPTLFLKIQINPVIYNPKNNIVSYIKDAKIKVDFEKQMKMIKFNDNVNLLIITANEFKNNFSNFINHKISKGISTKLVSIDEIKNETYFQKQGRDEIEIIKYFIKNAYDNWNTRNVLLIGDSKNIPGREVNINVIDEDSEIFDNEIFPSDLYYADLYDGNNNFSSWDTNNNDIFGERNNSGRYDEMDLYPDVKLGRLACTTEFDLNTALNKIINYENGQAWAKNWFNDIVVIGGDTIPSNLGDTSEIDEGEYSNQAVLNIMDGFIANKIWDSNKKLSSYFLQPSGKQNIRNSLSKGCGFVHFSGHGSPFLWTTYPHNGIAQSLPTPNGQYTIFDIWILENAEKLPIVMCGGCSLGNYDVNYTNFAWSFIYNPYGGGIASFGASGLGYIYSGEYITTKLVEGLIIRQYKAYDEGALTLGDMNLNAYIDYLDTNEIVDVDYKTLSEWIMYGDPTLQIKSNSQPPIKPDKPIGELISDKNIIQNYSVVTTDPDNDSIYYLFDWGDGTYSEWLGPYGSGEICNVTKKWNNAGNYLIKVKAKDTNGVQSEWSDPLGVTLTKVTINNLILRFLERFPRVYNFLLNIFNI